jgi:steroid 5-alpha reductase family enzyme
MISLAYCLTAFSVLWVISLFFNLVDVIDMYWGLGFFTLAILYSDAAQTVGGLIWPNFWARPTSESLLLGMLAVWGLRLSTHIILRSMNKEFREDPRYTEQRAKYGTSFWWVSFFNIFLPHALLQWVGSFCLMFSILATYARTTALRTTDTLTGFDILGFGVWLFGFVVQSIADWQLLSFQRNAANKGRVCTSGLWSLSRHPNHFGDLLVWLGYFITSLNMLLIPDKSVAFSAFVVSIASPLAMYWMLDTWKGAKKIESVVLNKRPGYAEYRKCTPEFMPKMPQHEIRHITERTEAVVKGPEPIPVQTRTVTPAD